VIDLFPAEEAELIAVTQAQGRDPSPVPAVEITSYGRLHGAPPEGAHLILNAEHLLLDPHVTPELRELTGRNKRVITNVMRQPGAARIVGELARACMAIAPATPVVRVAVGCAGGRHRSVVLAEECASALRDYYGPLDVTVVHRDIDKPVVER
jgi:RNase adaptor protein for sRNA GlmZ degradation